ncbi:uncharacterized protein [Arachis hypogaea]|uniref:uncharacterized protein n=1 Tax=Arachis hypogaea TaxID=3818 RepID=UPI003B20EBAD
MEAVTSVIDNSTPYCTVMAFATEWQLPTIRRQIGRLKSPTRSSKEFWREPWAPLGRTRQESWTMPFGHIEQHSRPLLECRATSWSMEKHVICYWATRFLKFDAKTAGEKRLLQLNELDEFRQAAFNNAKIYKERAKKWHDKKISSRVFEPGQKVLLFNSKLKLFLRKLKSRWTGPFVVTNVSPYGYIELQNGYSDERFTVNGQRVKHYLGDNLEQESSKLLLT